MSTNLTLGSTDGYSCTIGRIREATVPAGISVGEIAYWPSRNPQGNATRPQDTYEWKALAPCCESAQNVTKVDDDCVLWCELPRDKFPPNPSHDPPKEGKYMDRFTDCLKKNLPKGFDDYATFVRYPNNVNKTNGDRPAASTSTHLPSPTAGAPNGSPSDKSAAVSVLRTPNVLSLGLVTVMAGVYTMLS
ncbi:uncharacterized protein PG998_013902 [Apiospora kogelbergensis]|uniref:Uncharacterized protein n=1 Tax=Apiospora kogelbergensis TaxID=1337665 RepID=A0AAW0R012_9PEZI